MKFYLPAITAALSSATSTNAYLFPSRFGLINTPTLSSSRSVWREADRMMDRMDKLFTDELTFADRMAGEMNKVMRLPQKKYNTTDDTDKFQVTIDLPGVEAGDIDIKVEKNVLTMNGERKVEDENFISTYKFHQSFTLDPAVNKEKITADLKDGVLLITAPKNMKLLEQSLQDKIASEAEIDAVEEDVYTGKIEDVAPNHSKTTEEIKRDLEEALKKMK